MWRTLAFCVVIFWSTFVNGQPQRPCYFIFGDSISDAGNNNRLITMAKTNYPPYGVDFPGQIPTGRFTNGRTIVDVFSELMGFQNSVKTYSNITLLDPDIVRGVNFASGAAGILPESGSALGDRVWMDRQLANYKLILLKLQLMVEGLVKYYVNRCFYIITMGSNDYINNYFLPQNYPTSRLFTVQQFARLLRARFRTQLQTLYNSGARRVVVFGLGQLGCIPATIARNNATQCVTEINQAVELFDTQVRSLVDDFNANLPGARFTFVNITAIQTANPLPPGFITDSTCCQLRSDFQCEPNTPPCADRNIYAFMDGFHPTEIVNQIAATTIFTTQNRDFVGPFSFSELLAN
ncbi:GDSL esterase/lipase At1g29670-like [Amaranthus tricolor]|uniref:GDSL esterase/lipase At1g29670-like n=1 Tax=Amaranthus tricolor TaxID=29722 RepID=UPI00258971B9|nr:GDSL esterase/lipase At1g29670-like [Amaranthus tricolor]